MTVIEMEPFAAEPTAPADLPAKAGTLALWDGPNMRTTTCELVGNGDEVRINYRPLMAWLEQHTAAGEPVEAILFLNADKKDPESLPCCVRPG